VVGELRKWALSEGQFKPGHGNTRVATPKLQGSFKQVVCITDKSNLDLLVSSQATGIHRRHQVLCRDISRMV
jgi:hypothetical protein